MAKFVKCEQCGYYPVEYGYICTKCGAMQSKENKPFVKGSKIQPIQKKEQITQVKEQPQQEKSKTTKKHTKKIIFVTILLCFLVAAFFICKHFFFNETEKENVNTTINAKTESKNANSDNKKTITDTIVNNNSGLIKGHIGYPSDGLPGDLVVNAINIKTGKWFSTNTFNYKTLTYTLKVDTGKYYIYAIGEDDGFKSYYTEFIKCGQKEQCLSHKIIIFNVNGNQTLKDIDILDWYDLVSIEKELPVISNPKSNDKNTFKDARDNKVYKTIQIGTQTWMAENLAYKVSSGCWAYDNNATNVTKYGYLYDWKTTKKVCPSGWHLPSDAEWTTLTNNLGGEDVAGKKMKSTSGWNDYDGESGNGTNTIGFSALPGGYRYGNETFDLIGDYGYWWSSTEYSASNAYYRYMHGSSNNVIRDNYGKTDGISVRCVRDF